MPRMTEADLIAFQRRTAKPDHRRKGEDDERESELHEHIAARCSYQGWLFFHGSMAHRTHRTIGEPDFTILAKGGRCILVEAKAKNGKVTPEQNAVIARAKSLGHHAFVVWSKSEWDLIEKTFV